jgi:hypothetical protein
MLVRSFPGAEVKSLQKELMKNICLGKRALPPGLCWSWSPRKLICLPACLPAWKEGSSHRSVLVLVCEKALWPARETGYCPSVCAGSGLREATICVPKSALGVPCLHIGDLAHSWPKQHQHLTSVFAAHKKDADF